MLVKLLSMSPDGLLVQQVLEGVEHRVHLRYHALGLGLQRIDLRAYGIGEAQLRIARERIAGSRHHRAVADNLQAPA